jgi:hypothetical protein
MTHILRRIARRERERRNDKRVVTRTRLHHCGGCGCRIPPHAEICGACATELLTNDFRHEEAA